MYIHIDDVKMDIGYYRLLSPVIVLDRKCEYGDILTYKGHPHIIASNFNYKAYDETQVDLEPGRHVMISNLELVIAMSSDTPIDIHGFIRKTIITRFYKCIRFDKNMNEHLDKDEYHDITTYKYLRMY